MYKNAVKVQVGTEVSRLDKKPFVENLSLRKRYSKTPKILRKKNCTKIKIFIKKMKTFSTCNYTLFRTSYSQSYKNVQLCSLRIEIAISRTNLFWILPLAVMGSSDKK